jgi:hypothetical protein
MARTQYRHFTYSLIAAPSESTKLQLLAVTADGRRVYLSTQPAHSSYYGTYGSAQGGGLDRGSNAARDQVRKLSVCVPGGDWNACVWVPASYLLRDSTWRQSTMAYCALPCEPGVIHPSIHPTLLPLHPSTRVAAMARHSYTCSPCWR